MQITAPQGRSWALTPHPGDLKAAEGGFETPLGWFGAKWEIEGGRTRITVQTPEGTSGIVTVPGNGTNLQIDGIAADIGEGRTVVLNGGNHTIVA